MFPDAVFRAIQHAAGRRVAMIVILVQKLAPRVTVVVGCIPSVRTEKCVKNTEITNIKKERKEMTQKNLKKEGSR